MLSGSIVALVTPMRASGEVEKLTELFGPCGLGWFLATGTMEMTGQHRVSKQNREYYVHIADFPQALFYYFYLDGEEGHRSDPIPAAGSGENENRAWAIRSALTSCLGTAAKWLCWQLPLYKGEWSFTWSQGRERSGSKAPTNGAGQQAPAGKPGLWVMPFGKHKGTTLDEIYADEETRGYLSWIMVNISDKPDITDAVRAFLDAMENQAAAPTEKADAPERPYDPETLKTGLLFQVARKTAPSDAQPASKKKVGLLAGKVEECFAGASNAEEIRHSITEYLFGKASLQGFTRGEADVFLD